MKKTSLYLILAFTLIASPSWAHNKTQVIFKASEKITVTINKYAQEEVGVEVDKKTLEIGEGYSFDPSGYDQGLYRVIVENNLTSTLQFVFVDPRLPSGFVTFLPVTTGFILDGFLVKFYDTTNEKSPKIKVDDVNSQVIELPSDGEVHVQRRIKLSSMEMEHRFDLVVNDDANTVLRFRFVLPFGIELISPNSGATNSGTSSSTAPSSAVDEDQQLVDLLAEYMKTVTLFTSSKLTEQQKWAMLMPLQKKLNECSARANQK